MGQSPRSVSVISFHRVARCVVDWLAADSLSSRACFISIILAFVDSIRSREDKEVDISTLSALRTLADVAVGARFIPSGASSMAWAVNILKDCACLP